jgi:CheY-like chemotaxis protein
MPQATILVVEDESITALAIQQSLRRQGYNVPGIAASGSEALGLVRTNPPDLVLMDIRLRGDLDGIETAKIIREQFNTPIVFLTASADASTLQRAKSADPFAYLLKPFEEAVLATTIEIALHKHRTHELLVQQNLEALRLSQQRFENLARSIPECAIVLLDPAGLICSWNPGAGKSTAGTRPKRSACLKS